MALLLSLKRTVDLEPGLTAPQVFHVSQNDVGTKLYVGLEQGGTAYTIPEGTTAKVQGCNALGEPFEAITATVSASEVYFTITDQDVTQFAGNAKCEVVLTNGTNILGTANFVVAVEASPMGSDVPAIYTNPVQAYIERVVQDYVDDDILPDITTDIASKADASDVGDLTELETTDKTSIVDAVNEVVSGKVNIAQGSVNAGKALVVNSSGNVEPVDALVTVDSTLSVQGDAADAKATGDALKKVSGAATLFNTVEEATFTNDSFYDIGAVGSTVALAPSSSSSGLSCAEFTCSAGDVFQVALLGGGSTAGGGRAYGFLDSSRVVLIRADRALNLDGEILVAPTGAAYLVVNSFVPTSGSAISERYAIKGNRLSSVILDNTSDISTLKTTSAKARVNDKTNIPTGVTSANNLANNTTIFVSVSGGSPTITDTPFAPCWIETIAASSSISLQLAYPYSNFDTNKPQFRVKKSGTFGDWQEWGKVQTFTYSLETSNDTYNNTYNITTTPTITTDDNGWLNAVDTDTADETNKTDMTGAIMSMLTDTGYCHLGPGIFYVSGNIDMPRYSTLEGCGESTIVRLLSSVTSGYIVGLSSNNLVSGIRFSGGRSDLDVSGDTVGGRIGISYTASSPTSCNIRNCSFENFSGSGIYCSNTGGTVYQALKVVQCYIRRCMVGININAVSEYHKFIGVVTYNCHWSCINNGGNNIFVGCTFGGLNGLLIDNSQSDKDNNGHGACVGCTFNHISGKAIQIINCDHGFVFSGCLQWYGKIEILNSRGIMFNGCQFGGNSNYPPRITQVGTTYPVWFMNSTFSNSPTFNTELVKCINCFVDSTGAAVTAD